MLDFMIDHFNGIMNLYICALLILLAYMLATTDIQQGFYEFKQMVQAYANLSELFDALSKTRL